MINKCCLMFVCIYTHSNICNVIFLFIFTCCSWRSSPFPIKDPFLISSDNTSTGSVALLSLLPSNHVTCKCYLGSWIIRLVMNRHELSWSAVIQLYMIALHIHISSSPEISNRCATAIAGTDQNILQFYFGQYLRMDPKITQ